jgi:hypothetical protein
VVGRVAVQGRDNTAPLAASGSDNCNDLGHFDY